MPNKFLEDLVANAVAGAMSQTGRDWGTRGENGKPAVDYVFDGVSPRVALEITTLSPNEEAVSAGEKLATRLTKLAESEGLGQWILTVDGAQDLRQIDRCALDLMRGGESTRPGAYTSQDLFAWQELGELNSRLRRHRRAKALGIIDLQCRAGGSHEVAVLVFVPDPILVDWKGPIELALRQNASKFANFPDYERHLAVGVTQLSSAQLERSPPDMDVPETFDCLWLVLFWPPAGGRIVWEMRRGSPAVRHRVPL